MDRNKVLNYFKNQIYMIFNNILPTNKVRKLDENKIMDLNDEINRVYKICVSKGLSRDEVLKIAEQQISSPLIRKKRISIIYTIFKCILLFGSTLYLVFSIEPVNRRLAMYGRNAMFKVSAILDIIFCYYFYIYLAVL